MKRNPYLGLLAIPLAALFFWVGISFVIWEWNPANWSEMSRFMFVWMTAATGWIGLGVWATSCS